MTDGEQAILDKLTAIEKLLAKLVVRQQSITTLTLDGRSIIPLDYSRPVSTCPACENGTCTKSGEEHSATP